MYYHYTSITSLYKIVKNKTLLLSGVQSLNDMEEASYSVESFENDFKTLYAKKKDSSVSFLYEQVFLPKKDEFEKLAAPEIDPFVFSLSAKRDSLAHWDRYADSRRGVCIGIDVSKLQKLPVVSYGFVQIHPIIYKNEERLEYLCAELMQRRKSFEKSYNASEETKDLLCKEMGYTFVSDLYRQMKYFVKNIVWEDENEIRLAYEDTLTKDMLSQIPHLQETYKDIDFPDYNLCIKESGLNRLDFKLINSMIRACRFFDVSSIWNSGLIAEVMLGPKCEQNPRELERFLKNSGLPNPVVTESVIKIR